MADPVPTTRRSTHPLGRTVPEDAFSREGLDQHVATETPPGTRHHTSRPPQFDRSAIAMPGEAPGPRYELREVLGTGATGRVYALVDRNLDRPVAAKVLSIAKRSDEDVAAFIQEARLTAALAHPNVLPVHELDVDGGGDLYFTMKRIDGRSLGEVIDASRPGARDPAIGDANAVVGAFIGVCQALAYAHHRGVVHQDVKPANIMLGAFGEVLLVDWGSAARLDGGTTTRLYGTPLYMSPEQARREPVDALTDVYSLGATLFHALVLRVPTWSEDSEAFWAMKREGRIAPPRPDEVAGMPAALVDIALKALAADRAARYPNADAMLADLRAFQGGLAVSAHRDGIVERLSRWHRRHARALWSGVAVAAVVIALVLALVGERLKEIATWGAPIVVERFDDGWQKRWRRWDGDFAGRADGGGIVSTSPTDGSLLLDRRLSGAIAIECDAESVPGRPTGDLSLFWCRDYGETADGGIQPHEPMYLQFGAHSGVESAINRNGARVAYADQGPVPGRVYRIRAEIVDDRVSLLVDGRTVCTWIAPNRFDGGYVGIYAYYPGKAFANLRVMTRVAERVPATAIGDAFVAARDDSRAATQYGLLIDGHAGLAIEREARFKAGCCRSRQGLDFAADALWAPLADTPFAALVALERIDRRFAAHDHAAVLAGLDRLLDGADDDVRHRAAMRWTQYALNAPWEDTDRYLALHDRLLADDHSADSAAAELLFRRSRFAELRQRYPRQAQQCAASLVADGLYERVLSEYPQQAWERDRALLELGRGLEVDPAFDPVTAADALSWSDRPEEAVRIGGGHDAADARSRALSMLGRFDESMRLRHTEWAAARAYVMTNGAVGSLDSDRARAFASLAAGDDEAAAAALPPDGREGGWTAYACGIDAWAAGDRAAARQRFASCHDALRYPLNAWSLPRLVEPFLPGTDGDWRAFDAACAELVAHGREYAGQRPWYAGRWLRGEIDDRAFRAQPYPAFADADLELYGAMRAERRGDAATARERYTAWLARPRWRRAFEAPAPWERLARWRLAALPR